MTFSHSLSCCVYVEKLTVLTRILVLQSIFALLCSHSDCLVLLPQLVHYVQCSSCSNCCTYTPICPCLVTELCSIQSTALCSSLSTLKRHPHILCLKFGCYNCCVFDVKPTCRKYCCNEYTVHQF